MQQPALDFRQNLIQKIAKWKAGLAELGKRNPLIKFKQDNPRTLEIQTDSANILFQNLVFDKKTLNFQIFDSEYQDTSILKNTKALPGAANPLELITRQTGSEQLKRLKKLRSEARLSFEERGINSLFLALGTLTWYDKDKPEEALTSPLILVPVELIKEPRRDKYKISALEEDVVLNPTLAQKLKQTFGIELPEPETLQELNYDEIITLISQVLVEFKTWHIQDNVFLSLFSYAKAAIVRDIIENEAKIFSHPILRAISGDFTSYQSNFKEPPNAEALDSLVKPEQIFQILDADSSQQVVIEAAKRGTSFVVQGPPGTGKSQTIVNMIAELVGDDKSVLMVAEKETALSVVYKRMAECGLDHICLNLHHSGTTDKRKLTQNLDKTIDYVSQIASSENHNPFFEKFNSNRQLINLYHTSLHTPEKPLEKSAFEIFGTLLKKERERVPDINIILSNFSQWDVHRLQEAENLLNHLAQFLPLFQGDKTTIWSKSSLVTYSYNLELEIKEKIEEFQQAIILTQNISQELQRILQIQALSNLESLENCYSAICHIIKAPAQLPEGWAKLDISIAREAFNILEKDIQEMEKKKLSQEAENLLAQLSSFLLFLRKEKTLIWEQSSLKYCSETQEFEMSNKIQEFQQAISLIQTVSQQLEMMLKIQPLLNLRDVQICYLTLQHILKAPSNLPENWTLLNISIIRDGLSILRDDVREIEKNKPSVEAENLLRQLSMFLPFLREETKTIWHHSKLQFCSEPTELEINDKIESFQQSIASLQTVCQKLQSILHIQPILNLENLEASLPALNYILNIPSDLPHDWNTVDVSIAQDAFAKLKADVTFLGENEPFLKHKYRSELFSSELSILNNRFQRYNRYWIIRIFNPRYRNDINYLKKLRIQEGKISFNELKRDLSQAVEVQAVRNKLYESNYPARQVFGSLFNPEFSRQSELIKIEQALSWLINLPNYSLPQDSVRRLINSPSLRQELGELVKIVESFPNEFNHGMIFLTAYFNENDIIGQHLSTNQILFTDLIKFLNQAKTDLPYFRNWLTYQEIRTKLENLGFQEFVDALRDNKPNPIIILRNKLSQADYLPAQVFGSLFHPQISSQAELKEIEEALNWRLDLQQYSLDIDSVQQVINSPSYRQELVELFEKIQSFPESFRKGMNFLLLYFKENDIAGQYLPHAQISFSDLANFLSVAKADLSHFRNWLTYKEIYTELENLGLQEFVDALRDNKLNPMAVLKNKLNQSDYLPAQIFGSLFNPQISNQTELTQIKEAINWLVDLQQYSVSSDLVQQIINSPRERHELSKIVNQIELVHKNIKQGLDFILSYFNESDITDSYLPQNKITFVELENFLNIAQSELSDFQEWLTYKETYAKLENLGIKKFLDALRERKIEPLQWFPCLEKIIYKICLDAILAQKPELKNFDVEVHERQIQDFSKLDSYQLDAARERLKKLHARRWQNHEKSLDIQAELRVLKREVSKKRQHLPIRKLLNDKQKGVPNLVKALKPCWMMSPLSVSQYIDANIIHFDVLIFDEASQLRTEDVIPAIIRADQVIVIGDNKQLPPTSFFVTGDNGEDEEDEEDEDNASYESVLDECWNFMFRRTLKWHYRSRDERLIAFSNKHFYDSQLITFPNPVQNPNLGVCFRYVPDGIYDRGGRRDNRLEAEVVAQLTLEHFQSCPNESLGIIAFSEAQANAIQEQIEILGKDHPEFEIFCSDNSPQFFLKALENVQGDERDVILLSVGYARDSLGKLNLNFGPIIKQGGERRLNVAITRAKNKITLVSSLLAEDIDLSRTKSKGLELLRDYLEYAASGGERLEGNFYTSELKFDSAFEEDVYYTLVERGYTIRTQVGCSGYRIDLAVVNKNHPGEFLLGVECDGASYHSLPTARDRDRLRQQVLEKLGWNIHRIWSTDWFRNKPAQVRILVEKIEMLQNIK
ncbi:MAG: DUF4011 domain-containing protein [Calothrix sp. C42_A2020_038]|nr:DUF4011 domain-containing protein [Calothrix sp. C42_A2020_038]